MVKLRMGLQYGDDDDEYKPPQERTDFAANRDKSNFQKNMDDLLFSGGPPPPRRRRGQAPPAKQEPKPQPPKKQEVFTSKDSYQVNTSIRKQVTKPVPPPPKKVDNFIKPKQPEPQPQIPIVIDQPKNVRQNDTEEQIVNVGGKGFNRPGYIRKLKKIAQDFDFNLINVENHLAHDVVRPLECLRGTARRYNVPDFEDKQFPPDSYSIGPQYRSQLVIWKRPSEVYRSPVFGKYIQPNDIDPGSLSSPQFLSTLSCLAERQQNIKRLIEGQKYSYNGFYYVRINVNGVWRYVSVDDNLPELDQAPIGARSFNDSQAELWPSIIQKAYAKVYLGYNAFAKNVPREHYLRDLTGAPVKRYDLRNPEFASAINQALEQGWPVVAVPDQSIMDIGFNPNYSLSVLKCNSKGSLELRSSWGTVTQRPMVSLSKQGTFELSSNQSANYISHVLIAETDLSMCTSTLQSKHYGSFYSCFNFKIDKTTNGYISISQFDKRLFSSNAQYDYVPFRMILELKNASDEGQSVFVNAAFSHHSRNLDMAVNLAPGSYHLYCIGQWPSQPYDYDVTIHAKDLINLKKVYYNNFPNLIAEALTQQNLSLGKRSAKGHVDQYILYHEPSNLVLITANSLTDKQYTFTLNLSQVKFENLTLLNTVSPDDKFSKKTREELEDYKISCFNRKTWDVSLLPEQKYTWIFSSNEDYDPSNFKKWGFK